MALKVFVDTNIYEAANFSFYNKQFTKLRELIEEESVELLYNEIINQEVYQHIGDNVANAVSEYNHVVDDNRAFAPFRMNEKWKDKISRIRAEDMVGDLRKQWDYYISDTSAIKIPINGVDVDRIMYKYFNKKFPFENKKTTGKILETFLCIFSGRKSGEVPVLSLSKNHARCLY